MKTISELRLEGDARVSIHDMNRFEAAILGGRGDLDAWLECNNEEEVRLHIGKLLHLCVADLQHENQSLRTKIEATEQQVPYCWTTSPPSGHYSRFNPEVDRWIENGWTIVPLYLAPGAQDVPKEAIAKILTEVMNIAVANGADSRSMTDEYVEVAAWLCGIPAQPAPSVSDGCIQRGMAELEAIRNSQYGDTLLDDRTLIERIGKAMLAAAPEAKP